MRNFIFGILLLLCSCSATRNVSYTRKIEDRPTMRFVIENNYPELLAYFDEDVMVVKSLKEVVQRDGSKYYPIKYGFTRFYYNASETVSILKNNFPELYEKWKTNKISVTSAYKYVSENGLIKVNIDYKNIYNTTVYPYNYGYTVTPHYSYVIPYGGTYYYTTPHYHYYRPYYYGYYGGTPMHYHYGGGYSHSRPPHYSHGTRRR